MPTTSIDDFPSLLLQPFPLEDRKISLIALAGGGRAGYLFKARVYTKARKEIGQKFDEVFALKLFKFDNPEINVCRRKDLRNRVFQDPFYIECRANGTLIQQGLNGHITPSCHGWIDVSTSVETQAAKRFKIHPLSWERPATKQNARIRGILFDWIDGEILSRAPLNSDLATQARRKVKELHSAGIVHGDLAASNLLVNAHGSNMQLHLVDLSASIALPHVKFSAQDLVMHQAQEIRNLEIGLYLLSRLPVNEGLRSTDVSSFKQSALDNTEYRFVKHLWAAPQPTCWQDKEKRDPGL